MAMLNSFLDDFPLHPSLRIPPLLDPSPDFAAKSALPSPLEPNARVTIDIDIETAKLTGRRKALAEAKPIGEPAKSSELRPIQRGPRKRQKLQEYERIADFVQLPAPKTAKNDKPRPFQPVSVVNELHEPPPSAALFPPITPNEPTHEHSQSLSSLSLIETSRNEENPLLGATKARHNAEGQSQKRTAQRPRTKWTTLETEHLEKGVEIYGIGKWKKILNHPGFSFQQGRTPVDLKDHHRTRLKSQAAKRISDPVRSRAVDASSNTSDSFWNSVINTQSSPPSDSNLGTTHSESTLCSGNNRKGTWTDIEDENLEKGYKKYGFSWTRIAKDPELDLAHRTGPQVRDRFRTKFPALYGEDPRQHIRHGKEHREKKEQREQQRRDASGLHGSSSGAGTKMPTRGPEPDRELSRDNGNESDRNETTGDHIATTGPSRPSASTSSAYNILGLLNSDGDDDRPSAELPLETWDTNVTLPPLLWEEMATRPMFDLE